MTSSLSKHERELHDHYARNARALGHREGCRKITDKRNWPMIGHRSPCTCEPRPMKVDSRQ